MFFITFLFQFEFHHLILDGDNVNLVNGNNLFFLSLVAILEKSHAMLTAKFTLIRSRANIFTLNVDCLSNITLVEIKLFHVSTV